MKFPTSPFYNRLDNARIRRLVHEVGALSPGDRLVLLKGLVPGLVDTIDLEEMEGFLGEVATKARRYGEAERRPGEGRLRRETPARLHGLASAAPAPKSPELYGLAAS